MKCKSAICTDGSGKAGEPPSLFLSLRWILLRRESEEGAARLRVSCRGQSIITTLPQRLHLKLEAQCVWNPGVGEKAPLSFSTQKFLLFGIFPTRAFDCVILRLYWNNDRVSESLKVII